MIGARARARIHSPRVRRPRIHWRSPIRGPWLTSVLGTVLLVGIPIEFLTGLLSYAAYNPRLTPGQDPNPDHGLLGFYLFDWFTTPAWLYRVNEGVHVMLGYAFVPVIAAKLWSVIPKLFTWPRRQTLAKLAERASLILLVGGIVFQTVTGILYVDYDFVYGFSFYTGHFFGAWLFMAGFVIHVALKFPAMVRALRSRRLRTELRTPLAETRPEEVDDPLVAPDPAPPSISRRGALAVVGGSSLLIFVLTAGETIGGWTRRFALFGTHDRPLGTGPNDFVVNHTAASVGVSAADTGPSWRLELVGAHTVSLSREQLLAMTLTTVRPADRLHRGLVDDPDVDGRAARGAGRARRSRGGPLGRPRTDHRRRRHRALGCAGARVVVAAGAAGERGRPLARPRLPGPRDRAERARHLQHQMDASHHLRGGLTWTGCAVATEPGRCTCSR